jgi:hypothetical protein
MLLYAFVGNPDLAQRVGKLDQENFLLQSGDFIANSLIILICFLGQLLRFAIQQRIIKRQRVTLGMGFFVGICVFAFLLLVLYERFQSIPWPNYQDTYFNSPFQASLYWVFFSIFFFVGLDSLRRIELQD